MTNTLISTKFHNPLVSGNLTSRPRLDSILETCLSPACHLVLVTAPAGFGKSTLVSAWILKQTNPFSWLSLDKSDNEPRQFLSYLVGALQKIDPSLGSSEINRIQTAEASDSEAVYADVMKNLINEISGYSTSFILVLDDCHIIKNPLLLKLIIFLIEHQPPQLRLFLLTREDLPLPVSRLRVRRQIIEIRQADLQFSPEETAVFLRDCMGIHNLTRENIMALEHRTEGWIAGLQLAGLSIKAVSDPEKFIQSFTGSDRYILDYFIEEVFSHQPEDIRNFLMMTSILDRFCAPLCDSILQSILGNDGKYMNNADEMLNRLEQSNLFLIPLDYKRNWYRYHHLFSDLLRHALSKTNPQKIPFLHLQASKWLEDNGYIQEAVSHAFLSQNWLFAADLVERHAWNMILHSQVGTVSNWCRTFPEPVISKRPALCIFHGWALIIAFKKDDFPAARVRIEQAKAALPLIDPQEKSCLIVGAQPVNRLAWVTGQITLLRSFILMAAPRREANPQGLVDLGQLSYNQLPPEDITGLSVSLLDICYASQARSDAEEAEKKFEHVIGVALSGGNYFGAVVAEYHRAHGLFTQGRLTDVIQFCREKKKIYEGYFKNPLQELPAIALLDQAMGCALLELNEADDAEQYLRSGLEVGQWMPREELPAYLALARLCAIKGDSQGVSESLRRLDMRWPDIKYCTQAVKTLYDLISQPDDLAVRKTAVLWVQNNKPEIGPEIMIPGIGPVWNDEADHAVYSVWALIQIMLGNSFEALTVIEPMLNVAVENKLVHRIITLSLLKAQALFIQGQKERAWKPLHTALTFAEHNGYIRILDQQPVLIPLFSEAMKQGIAPHFIGKILTIYNPDQFSEQDKSNHSSMVQNDKFLSSMDGLIEPLSNREIEVLKFMSQGLSNAEIAVHLYLSPNTLKSHTQNIYGKLDVHSRVQAVNKARSLNLID